MSTDYLDGDTVMDVIPLGMDGMTIEELVTIARQGVDQPHNDQSREGPGALGLYHVRIGPARRSEEHVDQRARHVLRIALFAQYHEPRALHPTVRRVSTMSS